MASIADVYVTVIPETSKVARDIKAAFAAVDKDAREAGNRWGKEIKDAIGPIKPEVEPETTKAKTELEKFRAEQERKKIRQQIVIDESGFKERLSLMGKEFDGVGSKLGGGLKLNLGLAAIGTLPAAATAIADVAGAIQQLAGAGLVLPGVFAGVASSVGVAKLSTQGMSDAFDALTKASNGTQKSVDAANKELAKLSPTAAETVKTVFGLKGTFEALRNIGSQNMFAGVSGALKGLVTADMPAVTRGIEGISRSLNKNILQATTSLGSSSSQGFMERIFGNTANAQGKLTAAIDPIIHAFGTLAAAGTDSLPRLATAVGTVADRFNSFITTADNDGRLSKWISDGLDGFTNLGNIVLNIGKSFTAITQAAGGGAGLLSTLQTLTEKMSTFLNSSAGQDKLKQFFADGRNMLGRLKDIAVQVGPVLKGMFDAATNAAGIWLPVIREALRMINSIPGGAAMVVQAFVAWKTISGVASLASSLGNIAKLLGVALPGAAVTGAGGISAALAGIQLPAWMATFIKMGGSLAALPATAMTFVTEADKYYQSNHPGATNENAGARGKTGMAAAIANGGVADPNRISAPGYSGGGGWFGPGPAPGYGASVDPNWTPVLDPTAARPGVFRRRDGSIGTLPSAIPPPADMPAVSSYMPPVVTEVPKGGTPNLPYAGTADPYGGTYSGSGYASDAALLANVPAGRYTQTQGADLTQGLADCSSAVEDLVNLMDGTSTAGRSMSTGNAAEWLTSHGFVPGSMPGAFNVGYNNEHMQATLPGGTPFNWGSDAAAARGGVGGTGASDPAFTSHYYRPVSGDPMSTMYGGAGADPSGALSSQDLTLRNAGQRVNDSQHTQEQAEGRLNELKAKGTATDRQLEAAEYAVAKAKREHQDAIDGLTVAQDKYNKSAQSGKSGGGNTDAQALGSGFLSGLGQIFGLDGSVFADPTSFGLFKIFQGVMGLKPASTTASSGGGQGAGGGGGGGLGGLLGLAQNFMPGGSGVPGMPAGNSPNLVDAVQFAPTGGAGSPGPGNNPGPGYNNAGIDLRGAQFGDSHGELSTQLSALTTSQNRWAPLQQNLHT